MKIILVSKSLNLHGNKGYHENHHRHHHHHHDITVVVNVVVIGKF